jgi:hypothetical protein
VKTEAPEVAVVVWAVDASAEYWLLGILSAAVPEDKTREIQPAEHMKVPSGDNGKQGKET